MRPDLPFSPSSSLQPTGSPLVKLAAVTALTGVGAGLGGMLLALLLLEFTRASHDCLVPMLLAVAGSIVAYRCAERHAQRSREQLADLRAMVDERAAAAQ
ncbi:hypothetical protein ACV229_01815 [Burkholderia sp. MR1-5-21]